MVLAIILVYLIDVRLNKVVETYIDVEVERLTNNIVNAKVDEVIKNINLNDLFLIQHEENSNVRMSYDTKKINELKSNINRAIQDELMELDNGNIDSYFIPARIKKGKFKNIKKGKFKNIKKGILCDVSLGSVRGSTLFANFGPTIPIRLLFSSQLNTDIDINVREYGINNAIVEVYLIIYIKEQITMPLTSKRRKIRIKDPLMIDILHGKIPDYYGGYIK